MAAHTLMLEGPDPSATRVCADIFRDTERFKEDRTNGPRFLLN